MRKVFGGFTKDGGCVEGVWMLQGMGRGIVRKLIEVVLIVLKLCGRAVGGYTECCRVLLVVMVLCRRCSEVMVKVVENVQKVVEIIRKVLRDCTEDGGSYVQEGGGHIKSGRSCAKVLRGLL